MWQLPQMRRRGVAITDGVDIPLDGRGTDTGGTTSTTCGLDAAATSRRINDP